VAERIQLKRSRGWGKPPGAVVVARPSKWGNPYRIGEPATVGDVRMDYPLDANAAVWAFEHALRWGLLPITVEQVRAELRGKDLCCWCPTGSRCHADVLLEIANA
jgi:hypothetical protein